MNNNSTDRTGELEQRLKAIVIEPLDSCVFFEKREGCMMVLKECRFCRFSKFDEKCEAGVCKFKRRGE